MEKQARAGWKFATRCVRAKREPDQGAGSLAAPIFQSSAFAFESVSQIQEYNQGKGSRYMYTRYANPTLAEVERTMATLESAEEAVLFASGQAATASAMLSLLRTGDEILSLGRIYGGTHHFFQSVLAGLGITTRYFQAGEVDRLDSQVSAKTKLLFVETPTNPTLEILDLSSLAAAANRARIPLVVDNTFATPCNQNPLLLGADLVIHSGTKYLGGHSDLMAGVVLGSAERIRPVRNSMKLTGACADPLAAFLLLRGLKTLSIRVRAQNENAAGVAAYLTSHPRVRNVYYPGLEGHPGHGIARRQMRGFGGIVTFDVEGGFDAAARAMDRLALFLRAATLGGVESNAMMPVLASHAGYSDEELARAGVSPGMIRLSVGIEDLEDLVRDLEQALA